MLAMAAMAAALMLQRTSAPCARVGRYGDAALRQKLDEAAQSPPSMPLAARACLAAAALRKAGRLPRRTRITAQLSAPMTQALNAVAPEVAPDLALGRGPTFSALAEMLPPPSVKAKPAPRVIPIDQSEQGFILWLTVEPGRARQARRLQAYLKAQGVDGVAPTYQVLRTASDWAMCGGEPFALPPPDTWSRAARTLGWIKARVVPAIGPVQAVSGYRDANLNQCAQGAKESAHLGFWALDLEPIDPLLTRAGLMNTLCETHKLYGQGDDIGLGFYAGVRFHIDDKRYRHWGFDPVAAPACAVAPAAGG